MVKQGLALEPQGIEPIFIDAFFLRIWENRRIFLHFLLCLWRGSRVGTQIQRNPTLKMAVYLGRVRVKALLIGPVSYTKIG
ncbi:hypothetical protein CER22_24140 [Bacillus sp. K2I17]|nr:hypothetical protein CER22_24140 [Bacillus sp. K2I17]